MAKAKILSRADILAADDRPREEIEVKEWGGSIYLRAMSAAEREDFEKKALSNPDNLSGLMARVVAVCAVDDTGARLFTEDDLAALNDKNGAVLQRLYLKASKMNRLTKADVEELVKN